MIYPPDAEWQGPGRSLVHGSIADDDLLWAIPCTFAQVTSLIQNPPFWIDRLPDKPRKIQLAEDFAIRVRLRRPDEGAGLMEDDESDCVVQGIDGTGVITIRPRSQDFGLRDDWKEHWREWERHALLDVATYGGQGYGHVQLTHPGESARKRAEKITAFLMLGADPEKTDPDERPADGPALYLNKILRKTPRRLGELTGEGLSLGETYRFRPIDEEELRRVNFTLLGKKSHYRGYDPTKPEEEGRQTSLPMACEDMAGRIVGGKIVVDEVIVKNYRR